jgi:hypothetical protein
MDEDLEIKTVTKQVICFQIKNREINGDKISTAAAKKNMVLLRKNLLFFVF